MAQSWFDEIDNPQPAQPGAAPQGAVAQKASAAARDWLDDVIDRQGMTGKRALVRAIYEQESGGGKADTSKPGIQGARGPLQVTEIAFRDMQQRGYIPKEHRWDNPEHSAEAGVAYLKHALKTHGDDDAKAAAFYFGGPDAIAKDGTIRRDRMDANKKKIGSYIDDVNSRMQKYMGASTQPASPTQGGQAAPGGQKPSWQEVMATDAYKAAGGEEREAVRNAYYEKVILPQVMANGDDPDAVRAAFDEKTAPKGFVQGLADSVVDTVERIWKKDLPAAGITVRGNALKQTDKSLALFDAIDAGAKPTKEQSSGTLMAEEYAAATPEVRAQIRAQFVNAAEQNLKDAAPVLQKMREFEAAQQQAQSGRTPITATSINWKDPGTWNQFKQWAGEGIGQVAVSMGPSLLAALITKNPAAVVATSAMQTVPAEMAARIDAREQQIADETAPGETPSTATQNADVMRYAGATSGASLASGLGQAALDVVAGPEARALKNVAGRTVKEVVKDLPAATAKSTGGEAWTEGAQQGVSIGTRMGLGEQGGDALSQKNVNEVIDAAAVGALGGAGGHVPVAAKEVWQARNTQEKAASLRNLAKRLRGEPVDAGEVLDQPEGAPKPAVASTPGVSGEVVPARPRQVAGVPIPENVIEEREKVPASDVEVLEAGDAGPGRRPALPNAPTPGAPLQIENRPTPEGRTGTIRVDSKGVATPELASEGAAGAAARERAEGLGTAPVRVPAPPAPAKKKGKGVKSIRSEYSANRALADRVKPGWTSPSGKTLEQVLAAKPKKAEVKPAPKKKLFGLFSKKAVETPQFKRWFGASKATDETGTPKVWYRGTATDNDTPRPRQAGAIFVAPDPDFAEMFAHKSLDHARNQLKKLPAEALAGIDEQARAQVKKNYEEQGVDEETMNYYLDNVRMTDEWLYAALDALPVGPNIQPYFVRAERPFDMADAKQVERVATQVLGGKPTVKTTSTSKGASQTLDKAGLTAALKRGDWTVLESDEVQAAIKALGHDSFYVTEGGRKNLAVYNPNQLKSATGNSGEFSESPSVIQSRSKKDTKEDGSPVKALRTIVDNFAKKNKGAGNIKIRVIAAPDGSIDGLDSLTEGVYLGADDQIVLVASAFDSLSRAQEVLMHEVIGHHGVEAVVASAGPGFEKRWIALLEEVARVRAKGGYASMEAVAKDYKDYPPLVHAMEVLARMAEKGEKHSLLTKAVSLIRDALRALGFRIKMNDADLIELVSKARLAVKEGKNKNTAETRAWHEKLDVMTADEIAALKSEAPAGPVWYSALQKAVGALKMNAATPGDWWNTFKGMVSKGVKREEIELSGIEEWLSEQKGKVTREQVMEYLRRNGVQVTDVKYGGTDQTKVRNDFIHSAVEKMILDGDLMEDDTEQSQEYELRQLSIALDRAKGDDKEIRNALNDIGITSDRVIDDIFEAAQDQIDMLPGQPAYSTYVLPGGLDYREILLTVPAAGRKAAAREDLRAIVLKLEEMDAAGNLRYRGDARRELQGARARAAEAYKTLPQEDYKSSHWDPENVVAHIRYNSRTDSEGNKVLFIEELQSDWAQDARKYGFIEGKKKGVEPPPATISELSQERSKIFDQSLALTEQLHAAGVFLYGDKPDPKAKFTHPETGAELTFEQAQKLMEDLGDRAVDIDEAMRDQANDWVARNREGEPDDKVPRGPFIGKTEGWLGLALKRIIRIAAEEGFDRVAWTTGEQQAQRYRLSHVVDQVIWFPNAVPGWPKGMVTVRLNLKPAPGRDSDIAEMLVDPKTGKIVEGDMIGSEWRGRNLSDVIGKELAQRAVTDTRGTIESADLPSIGGEGMKTFYNKIVPNVVNDVVKKIGGTPVTTVSISMPPAVDRNHKEFGYEDRLPRKMAQHQGFDITPEMRGIAMRGLPLFSKKKSWAVENAAFEVAPGGNAPIKAQWDALPAERRAEITQGISKAVVPGVAKLFTDGKVEIVPTTGGWMGGVNPSAALKMKDVKADEAKNIAAAVAYVFDQDAGLHISEQGTQDSVVVELAPGQDAEALYKSLPGNQKEFIGFTSSGEGVLEFLVDDASKSAPKLQAHFGPAKVTVVQRGFNFLGKKDYKAARATLNPIEQATLDAFREQARSLMKISLSPAREGAEVSTANVTAKRSWLDSLKQRIMVGIDHIFGLGPAGIAVHASLLEKMPNIRPKQGRTAAETIEHAIEHFRSNLLWLYDQVPEATRDRSKLWYVGGNKIASQMGKFYGISTEQGAGVIAVLSPQRDWFVNVSLARRVLDIWKHQQDYTADDAMYQAALADRTMQTESAKIAQEKMAEAIKGKKLSALSDPLEAAAWVRAYDDAFNARSYRVISPEGDTMGLARNDDGSPADIQWGSLNTIANAIAILRDGSMETISDSLGEGHKVRSFYSNILNPKDAGPATIDTHAVAAATLRPLSSDSPEVRNAFGGNETGQRGPVTSSVIGSNGTYGIYHEAYRRAAADRGISPREMQSITWEALRGLFTAAQKRMTFEPVEQLWNQYHRGKKTLAQVREELLEIADGIIEPEWTRPDTELDEQEGIALEAVRLSGAGWNDGVESGGAASVVAQGRRGGLKSVKASNGGSGVVEFSPRPPRADSVTVDAWHWSHSKVEELNGSMYGTGIKGAEAERLRNAPPQIRKRVYFYTKRDNGMPSFREGGLGPNRHEVRLANLWKSGVSPSIKVEPVGRMDYGVFVRDEAATMNAWEMALLEAGFDGYVNGESGVAVVLNANVPVTFVRTGVQSRAPQQPASVPADRSGLVDTLFKFGFGWVGRKLTTPAFDYLVRQGAKVIPERVKHGIVSDYGLEGQYLDAKIDRGAAVHKVLRETKNLLDSLSSLTREQSRIAYLWMNEKPDTELEQQLLDQLPATERAILANMKSLIDRLGQDAVAAGLLSQDSYERNKMSYLHRVYEKHFDAKDGTVAGGAAKRAAIRAENFKGRGIRHDVSDDALVQNIDEIQQGDLLDRWESRSPSGKVTAVKYLKRGQRGPAGYVNAGTWEARFFEKKGRVGMWRDLTPEERHKLGEIEEVRFSFAKTVINAVRDIENARFLKWVADNYATENAPAEKIISDPSAGYWSTETFKLDEFVKVPETTISGTGGIKKFGELAGKVIPAAIWNDVRNQLTRPSDGLSAMYDSLVRYWKVSKTALSPAVHTNNVMSNFIMADLAEVRARDVVKALQTIVAAKKGDAEARALLDRYEDSGADYGSFAGNELSTLYIEPLLAELQKIENNEVGLLKMSQIVNLAASGNLMGATKALGAKLSPAKVPFDLMLKAYQSEDSVFRLAKFMREKAAGHTDREAGKMARDSFLDYNINAPWVQVARRSVLPFISFSYRAIPLMLKAAAHKPWKFAKYFAVGTALNAAAYAILGLDSDDEDRERRMLPDELSGNLLGVFPRLVRMPWNDPHGSPVFLDMRRWIPGGDMVDLNQSQAAVPVPSWLSVSGPLSIMMEFFMNKSSFTGREIVKDTDNAAEVAAKVGDHLFKAFTPNLPLPGPGTIIPGLDRGLFQTYSWQGMLDAGTGRTDAFGRDQSLVTATLSSIGVKARVYPADALKQQAVMQYQQEAREIQNNIKNLARELSRNGITREKFEARVEREKAKLEKAGERLRKKIGEE